MRRMCVVLVVGSRVVVGNKVCVEVSRDELGCLGLCGGNRGLVCPIFQNRVRGRSRGKSSTHNCIPKSRYRNP